MELGIDTCHVTWETFKLSTDTWEASQSEVLTHWELVVNEMYGSQLLQENLHF